MFEERSSFRLGRFDSPSSIAPREDLGSPAPPVAVEPQPAPTEPAVPVAMIDSSMEQRTLPEGPVDKQQEKEDAIDTAVVGGFVIRRYNQELTISGVQAEPDAPRLPSYSTELVVGDRRITILVVSDKIIPEMAAPVPSEEADAALIAQTKEPSDAVVTG